MRLYVAGLWRPDAGVADLPVEVLFDPICREDGIEHLVTQARSPTTTGKIEEFHRAPRTEFRADGGLVVLHRRCVSARADPRPGRGSIEWPAWSP
jgi:transposase InsO family protein